jgi:small-conductance mechanosensitive channel
MLELENKEEKTVTVHKRYTTVAKEIKAFVKANKIKIAYPKFWDDNENDFRIIGDVFLIQVNKLVVVI